MKQRQGGLSLIELMIAMVIGLVLMTGVLQIFIGSKRAYTTQDAMSGIQENGRLAIDFMSRDARMAGYTGCASGTFGSVLNDLDIDVSSAGEKLTYDFEMPLEGLDNVGAVVAGWGGGVQPVAGTDVLFVRGSFSGDISVKSNNSSGNLRVDGSSTYDSTTGCTSDGALCLNDVVMISDCTKSRVFQVTNLSTNAGSVLVVHAASGTPGNNPPASWGGNSAPPNEVFGVESELFRVVSVSYFLGVNPSGKRALYQRVGTNAAVELIEGVQDLQILYGRDTTGDGLPDAYQAASSISNATRTTHVANWASVSSVRLQLLLQSDSDNVVNDPQTLTFNGVAVNPPPAADGDPEQDRRLRQVFVSTVGVRSRLR